MFARSIRWQMRALGRNPLVRRSDRLEALAVLAVLVTAVFAVPVATHAGAQVYDTGVRASVEQTHSRHAVEATAVEGSASMPADFDSTAAVRVQWSEGSRTRAEEIITAVTVVPGERLKVWLDDAGKVVPAPLTADDAKVSSLGAAGTVWVLIVALAALVAFAIRRGLDRSRDQAWERELHLLAHNDDGWANRHT